MRVHVLTHRRSGWLIVLLSAAFLFMTLVNMQQARVLDAQRDLIGVLSRDSAAYFGMMANQHRRAVQAAAKEN